MAALTQAYWLLDGVMDQFPRHLLPSRWGETARVSLAPVPGW